MESRTNAGGNGAVRIRRTVGAGTAVLAAILITASIWAASQAAERTDPGKRLRVFSLPAGALQELRREDASEKREEPALARLKRDADAALDAEPTSVMDKAATPPSGDKHDYMSMGPYWWPDPLKSNGLPYIRRDGEVNPETAKLPDHRNIQKLMSEAHTLALAYYVFDEERYAAKATQLLRVWFLDPQTRMNPNLNFGQAIPGRVQGRGTGLIDTRFFYRLVDAAGLLDGSKSWTADDQRRMEKWCSQFLDWLRESKNGQDESRAKNNHGSYYDVQAASLALFTGRTDVAKEVLQSVAKRRIGLQIEADGRQPFELARTKALGYSTMNLAALFELATLAENVGVNLWDYRTPDGRGLRAALDYLIPFVSGERKWPYQQISEYNPEEIAPLLAVASVKYHEPTYLDLARKVDPEVTDRIEAFLLLREQR